MARPIAPFKLPESAKSSLKSLLNHGKQDSRKLTRARILLLLDQGMGPKAIKEALGTSTTTIWKVRSSCETDGWEFALEGRKAPGAQPRIRPKAKAEITALACSDPPNGSGQWTLRLLADKAVELGFVESISHETVRQILKK